MNKGILIVGNPGEEKQYCEGVKKDIENYQSFFKSLKGGAWDSEEINVLWEPTTNEMHRAVQLIDEKDYSIIVFSGHGYSNIENETVLELSSKGDEYKDTWLIKNNRTVILDCCRKLWIPESIGKRVYATDLAESVGTFKLRDMVRKIYEEAICNSNGMPVVMYSCSLDEYAQDDSDLGGDYSYQLLHAANVWKKRNDYSSVLDVAEAHYITQEIMMNNPKNQHPRINKARSGNYYPFAIDL